MADELNNEEMDEKHDDDEAVFEFEEIMKLLEMEEAKVFSKQSKSKKDASRAVQEVYALHQALDGIWHFFQDRPVAVFVHAPWMQMITTLEFLLMLLEDDDASDDLRTIRDNLVSYFNASSKDD